MHRSSCAVALLLAAIVTIASACGGSGSNATSPVAAPEPDTDPPEVQVGERLFLETRFAEFFFANSDGDVNALLKTGDPVMDTTQTTGKPFAGPFRGQSMNCRSCHLVDELQHLQGLEEALEPRLHI